MSTFIEQEIAEQPDVIARLITEGRTEIAHIAARIRAFDPAFVMIAARGTSDNCARYAQYLLGSFARLPVALAAPSLHTLYHTPPNLSRALVIAISQSGQSDDVRQVVQDARSQGALTLAITNKPDSPLATDAEFHIDIRAGVEHSVAATKSYTAQLTAIALLAASLNQNAQTDQELQALPDLVSRTLKHSESIADWVGNYRDMDRFAALGRGYNFCTAFEVSLKIKELCYIAGVEYSEADFRHGPIAMVKPEFPVITVAADDATFSTMLDLLTILREKRADPLVISSRPEALALSPHSMTVPTAPDWLTPILSVIPGQVFAMQLALAKGHEVDRPTGLKKVTITS